MNNSDIKKFIYVFSEADRDIMIDFGYELVCEVPGNGIYVFLSDHAGRRNFSAVPDVTCCFSNTLTF